MRKITKAQIARDLRAFEKLHPECFRTPVTAEFPSVSREACIAAIESGDYRNCELLIHVTWLRATSVFGGLITSVLHQECPDSVIKKMAALLKHIYETNKIFKP